MSEKKTNQSRHKEPGYATVTKLYNECRRFAELRDLSFELTREEWEEISRKDCHYCGKVPEPKSMYCDKDMNPRRPERTSEETICNSWVNLSGIDRIDNNKGYTLENSVPSCFDCNYTKKDKTFSDFITHAMKIADFQRGNVSPSPVYKVRKVPLNKIRANSWNPNSVAPPEMELLETSIYEDGFTMPVVCYYIADQDIYEIVDGFHRYTTLKTSKRIFEREKGMLPVVVIDKDESNRMASTIRHNRARGSHSIDLMSNIVAELTSAGMSDAWILKHVGMDKDELLRLKQITGIADLFKDKEFSEAYGA